MDMILTSPLHILFRIFTRYYSSWELSSKGITFKILRTSFRNPMLEKNWMTEDIAVSPFFESRVQIPLLFFLWASEFSMFPPFLNNWFSLYFFMKRLLMSMGSVFSLISSYYSWLIWSKSSISILHVTHFISVVVLFR